MYKKITIILLSMLALVYLCTACTKPQKDLPIDNDYKLDIAINEEKIRDSAQERNFNENTNKLDDEIYKEIENEIYYIKNETASDIFYTLRYKYERGKTFGWNYGTRTGRVTLTERSDANKKRLAPATIDTIFSVNMEGENNYIIDFSKNYVITAILRDIIIYDANNKIFMTIRDFDLNSRNNYFNDIVEIIDGKQFITHNITITDDIIELGLPRHSLEGLIARKTYDDSFDHISDLAVFLEDKDIREIKIFLNSVDDLSPLTELHNLEAFFMGQNFFVKDISPLGTLTKLKRLSLSGWHQVQDYSPIARLENLEYLFFDAFPRGNFELTMLQNMVHLKELTIGMTVDEFGFLSNLVNLETMYFGTDDTDIDFIDFSHLTNLRDLEIHGNGNTINLEGIQHLKNLEFLRLEQFHVVDVRPLLELPVQV